MTLSARIRHILPFIFTTRSINAFLPLIFLVMGAKKHLKAGVLEELIRLSIKCLDAGIESVEE